MQLANLARAGQFLSTPSARRATGGQSAPIMQGLFLSTPSARRATGCCHERVIALEFLSTPSARRATSGEYTMFSIEGISIHALREEGDFVRFVRNVRIVHFYPRPPRGGRP